MSMVDSDLVAMSHQNAPISDVSYHQDQNVIQSHIQISPVHHENNQSDSIGSPRGHPRSGMSANSSLHNIVSPKMIQQRVVQLQAQA